MRNTLDFSSWQGVLTTLLGLVLVSFVAIGIRLLLMHGVQLRRERQNRQINERLKTLIAAYKTLGGSFTGELAVDPRHLRELRATAGPDAEPSESDRRRRMRDAVEAALSDVILLGTERQVRLAAHAANEMVAGRAVETAELVMSLRDFIREVLDLEAIDAAVAIPRKGRGAPPAGRRAAARRSRAVVAAKAGAAAQARAWAARGRAATAPTCTAAAPIPIPAPTTRRARDAAGASAGVPSSTQAPRVRPRRLQLRLLHVVRELK